ncbi:TPA: Pyruvate dehydrogenase complex component E2 1 [Trebouxia sp. C0005]
MGSHFPPAMHLPSVHALPGQLFHRSAACHDGAEARKKVIVIAMPMLSPTMTEGSLLSWMKQSGDQVEPYDLLFELETESLTEEAYRVGDFEGNVGMQIECVEDAFLAKQLVPPSSKSLPVGTPIGLLCEDEEDIQEVAQHQLPDDLNEYNKGDQKSYRFATWQSYLKERKVDPTGSCM